VDSHDSPRQRDLSDATAARIRETTKWLIGVYAAVGAALIAGSQLSDIGQLPACLGFSIECSRLWLAVAGLILALLAVAIAINTAVRVLVWQDMTLARIIKDWEQGERSHVRQFFNENPALLQGFLDPNDISKQEDEAFREFDELDARARNSDVTEKERLDIEQELTRHEARLSNMLAREEAFVAVANSIALTSYFRRTMLRWLLVCAGLAAVGVALFSWAVNAPPAGSQ
jgi:hypothetical protein